MELIQIGHTEVILPVNHIKFAIHTNSVKDFHRSALEGLDIGIIKTYNHSLKNFRLP